MLSLTNQYVLLESGDAVIFPGSWAHQIRHGIEEVIPGTCPPELADVEEMIATRRLCLQFRQIPTHLRRSIASMASNKA